MFGLFRKKPPPPARKVFARDSATFEPLAVGYGGCLCTDRVMVDGAPIGYFSRGEPMDPMDSGWSFFAGDETDAYLADTSRTGVYDVNTVANYDPAITPFLEAPVGSAFIRSGDGFVPADKGAASGKG